MIRILRSRLRPLITAAVEWDAWGSGALAGRVFLGILFFGIGGFLIWHGANQESGSTWYWDVIVGIPFSIIGVYFLLPGAVLLWFTISDKIRG